MYFVKSCFQNFLFKPTFANIFESDSLSGLTIHSQHYTASKSFHSYKIIPVT